VKDPDSGRVYYYSNVSKAAQWTPPKWIDHYDEDTGTLPHHYRHTFA
jgi:hypothetical protein